MDFGVFRGWSPNSVRDDVCGNGERPEVGVHVGRDPVELECSWVTICGRRAPSRGRMTWTSWFGVHLPARRLPETKGSTSTVSRDHAPFVRWIRPTRHPW